jgi:hypothetical protein
MSKLGKQQRAAIEAVAQHFSATWEDGDDPPDAYLTIARKRIAVDVVIMKQRIAATPRLRFDRVALRLVRHLRDTLSASVPDGRTVIVTVTAPIRLPAKTAVALEDKARVVLARRPAQVEIKDTMHGNQVSVRLVKGGSTRSSKVIGFVHNPDVDPSGLLGLTQSLIESLGAKAAKGAPAKSAGDRWLVLACKDQLSDVAPYRQVYSQLSAGIEFKSILLVLAGGQIESLTGDRREGVPRS